MFKRNGSLLVSFPKDIDNATFSTLYLSSRPKRSASHKDKSIPHSFQTLSSWLPGAIANILSFIGVNNSIASFCESATDNTSL